ncbi:hypothetical protein SBI_05628 [Streptomyces bingchenggensis BCW-1]|uniref:Uncharacterized protein n=1 Tax=Streptomyces bingchenggensis (strain BCW-1) TaxID=749414 RepID=D7CCL7_STRBB|nr:MULTISPECIES: nucleotidyl transferase AbiEii/AbiGii toxin family protein [Streptomyces]ADI08748.1 hypothetical protein SBI_05628 [Streptomyces bingchenggensis BCW-1]
MDELHRQLIRIGLDALAKDYGYALAGGCAVQAHHIVNRVSDDVDLFAPFERASREMSQAAERITTAYEAAGYSVEQAHVTPTCTRLNVTDPASGAQSKVELVAEFLHDTPVESDLGPVLHRDDVAAGKTSALFTRAEVRDAIDEKSLITRGLSGPTPRSTVKTPGVLRTPAYMRVSFSASNNTGTLKMRPGTGPRHDRDHRPYDHV